MVYQSGLVNLSLIETRGSSHGPASARASAWLGGEEPTSSASNFFSLTLRLLRHSWSV